MSVIILDSRGNSEPRLDRATAERVVQALDRGYALHYSHRDYCGMGLARDGSVYIYDSVHDGYAPSAALHGQASAERLVFQSREELLGWLLWQTDTSLSGSRLPEPFLRGNQRLTLERLRLFAANA